MTDPRRPPLDARPRPNGEGGSIVLALLVSMLALSVGGLLFVSIEMSERNTRQGRDYTTTVESADAGVQHAVAALNNGQTPAASVGPIEVGDATVTYTTTAVAGPNGGTAYEINALATSAQTGEQRRVVAVVEEEPRFPFAVFADQSIDFNGGNEIDSYTSGVVCTVLPLCAWSAPYAGDGIAATNEELTFQGNSTADGVTLYDWQADPDPTRCEQVSGGNAAPNPCLNTTYKSERLDLAAASEIQFLEAMEDYCETVHGPGNQWPDWKASDLLSVPAVLQAQVPYRCVHNLEFDIDTVLAPVGTCSLPPGQSCLDIQPVIVVVQRKNGSTVLSDGVVTVDNNVEVNCLAPCTEDVSVPDAPHLQIYTLGTGNNFVMRPQSSFAGAVYAPLAECGRSGSGQATIFGSVICRQIINVGGWEVHYDVALAGIGNGRYLVREWREEPV